MIKTGENPSGKVYRLPGAAKWNGEGEFDYFHVLKPAEDRDPICKKRRGETICLEEVSRSFVVKYGNQSYPAPTRYEDHEVSLNTPNEKGLLVDVYNITTAPLLDFKSPPFFPSQHCLGSPMKLLGPGNQRGNLNLYNIYLKIEYIKTTEIKRKKEVKRHSIEALGVAPNQRCDSFVTWRFSD
ncbi:hypothetical protein DSO57_1025516 [Entomophthora muscae]|uniref:Uncharacterized protein n=1 Tax=Entomophthora muscae TaxID=34485 RepID=A0ACC2U0H0_9FUNG|nr:hypothetical protein DSO57_1025516 [Entomophthora muscae]